MSATSLDAKAIAIATEVPTTADGLALLDELSATLAALTGSDGRSSFDPADVQSPRALFVVARDAAGRAIGCGAFRPVRDDTAGDGVAELKRMYARPGTKGVGGALLRHLEAEARQLGYTEMWLETRLLNEHAIAFYLRHGYVRRPNFGKYVGRAEAVCFEKALGGDGAEA